MKRLQRLSLAVLFGLSGCLPSQTTDVSNSGTPSTDQSAVASKARLQLVVDTDVDGNIQGVEADFDAGGLDLSGSPALSGEAIYRQLSLPAPGPGNVLTPGFIDFGGNAPLGPVLDIDIVVVDASGNPISPPLLGQIANWICSLFHICVQPAPSLAPIQGCLDALRDEMAAANCLYDIRDGYGCVGNASSGNAVCGCSPWIVNVIPNPS